MHAPSTAASALENDRKNLEMHVHLQTKRKQGAAIAPHLYIRSIPAMDFPFGGLQCKPLLSHSLSRSPFSFTHNLALSSCMVPKVLTSPSPFPSLSPLLGSSHLTSRGIMTLGRIILQWYMCLLPGRLRVCARCRRGEGGESMPRRDAFEAKAEGYTDQPAELNH